MRMNSRLAEEQRSSAAAEEESASRIGGHLRPRLQRNRTVFLPLEIMQHGRIAFEKISCERSDDDEE